MSVQSDRSEVEKINAWLVTLEQDPDWIEVENRPWANENSRWSRTQCQGYDFWSHDPRVKMRFFWNEKTETVLGSIHWDNRTEGPPGGSHGASIMLAFDEFLAFPVWRLGEPAYTGNVSLNFRKMIPFNQAAKFTSKIVGKERRKRYIEGRIFNSDESIIYADGTGTWIVAPGMTSTMAVHDGCIKADKKREANQQRTLVAPFVPGIETNVNTHGMLTIDAHRYRPLRMPDEAYNSDLYQVSKLQGLAQDFFQSNPPLHSYNYTLTKKQPEFFEESLTGVNYKDHSSNLQSKL